MTRAKKFLKFVQAIIRREPAGHISDLWGEFTGKLVLCGKPPNQYLMVRKELDRQKLGRDALQKETKGMTRDQGIEKARAWRQANWYDSVPEQLDEALYGYAADLTEELESQVRDLTRSIDGTFVLSAEPTKEEISQAKQVIGQLQREVRDLTGSRERFAKAVEFLLEWMPTCSVGSSGYARRAEVERQLAGMRGA